MATLTARATRTAHVPARLLTVARVLVTAVLYVVALNVTALTAHYVPVLAVPVLVATAFGAVWSHGKLF